MCGDSDIGKAPKALCHNSSHFEAIAVLPPHLFEDPLQRVLDLCRSNRTEKHHLHFLCQEREVPAGGTDLLIGSKAIHVSARLFGSLYAESKLRATPSCDDLWQLHYAEAVRRGSVSLRQSGFHDAV